MLHVHTEPCTDNTCEYCSIDPLGDISAFEGASAREWALDSCVHSQDERKSVRMYMYMYLLTASIGRSPGSRSWNISIMPLVALYGVQAVVLPAIRLGLIYMFSNVWGTE